MDNISPSFQATNNAGTLPSPHSLTHKCTSYFHREKIYKGSEDVGTIFLPQNTCLSPFCSSATRAHIACRQLITHSHAPAPGTTPPSSSNLPYRMNCLPYYTCHFVYTDLLTLPILAPILHTTICVYKTTTDTPLYLHPYCTWHFVFYRSTDTLNP
jgi:hypothetical protein